MKNFDRLVIYIPGICHKEITDPTVNEYLIEDLYPGSEYKITIVVSGADGDITYMIKGTTEGTPVFGQNLLANMVGKTFTQRN